MCPICQALFYYFIYFCAYIFARHKIVCRPDVRTQDNVMCFLFSREKTADLTGKSRAASLPPEAK